MSPEQVQGGTLDRRTDLFAVGVILYELLTGALPFAGTSRGMLMLAILRQPIAPPRTLRPAIPADLDVLVMHLLARERAQMPARAEAVTDALDRCEAASHLGRKQLVALLRERFPDGCCCGMDAMRPGGSATPGAGRSPRRFRRTTDSRHGYRIAPNLLDRDFSAAKPNEAWVGDITYVPTQEGWLYLAVLLDLFSRRVVGWAMSDRIDTELALAALSMATRQRRPRAGLIHHTDRDCRYASDEYQAALRQRGLVPSMSGKADCWDNAVAESFFATLEKELLAAGPLTSREATRLSIADYIENYYNSRRRHSYLDYVSPLEYELVAA